MSPIVVVVVLIKIFLCTGQGVINSTCSCENGVNSTLFIHCSRFDSGKVHDCFTRHEETETLIFRNSSLEKIPDEVSILKVIKNADFSENKLMHLGLQNSTCALLRTLNVDFNNITIIRREDLDCFSNLITLSITNNGLKTIEPGAFSKNLKHFRRLNAQFNGLVSLDTS